LVLLQNNVLNRRSWATRQHLIAIVTCIERTYHRRTRQTTGPIGPYQAGLSRNAISDNSAMALKAKIVAKTTLAVGSRNPRRR
jgi:hypothetical protein